MRMKLLFVRRVCCLHNPRIWFREIGQICKEQILCFKAPKIKNSFPFKARSHMTQQKIHLESTQKPTRTPSASSIIKC